jgi:hypothetical protein
MDLFEAVTRRLATAERRDDPFPHVIVDGLLPIHVYQDLVARWPDDALFRGDAASGKLDLVPAPEGITPADARAESYNRLDDDARTAWNRFVIQVNREIVGPFLERMFEPEIAKRLEFLQASADAPGLAPYLRPPYRAKMNVGRLMMRSAGFRLRPHVDSLAYLATALYYFPTPADNPDTEGTTLYRAAGEIGAAEILSRGKTVYFDAAGIGTTPASTVPFLPNTLLAFANTGRSAHGITITARGWRRAFQSHLSLKGDADHL